MTDVDLQNLTKTYAAGTAVQDISLTMPSGQITALLGPSGCGKTTTLKMIAGLIHPTSGSIRFGEENVAEIPAEQRGAVMVFQNHLLFPYMSVGENVAFGLRMRKQPRADRIGRAEKMLERVGLPNMADRKPAQLSGGQQQRVALARALVVDPEVLLLDEPLANLDAHLRDGMRDLILDVQRELGVTTIVVTHDQEEAVILADQIALMFDGEVEQFGVAKDYYERPASLRTANFFGNPNAIPAVVGADGWAETSSGRLRLNETPVQGEALLTVRPESIDVAEVDGENVVTGTVMRAEFLGTRSRYTVELGESDITIITSPSKLKDVGVGGDIRLRLDPSVLWALPADSTATKSVAFIAN